MTVQQIDVTLVRPGDNDRTKFDRKALEALAASIAATGGLISPIMLRPHADGGFEIVAGERRFRAVRDILGHDRIAAVVEDLDDGAAADKMLAENLARADLDLIDEARAYQRRIDDGATIEQVADVAGVSTTHVQWRLALLRLTPEIQEVVRLGMLGFWSAWEVSHLDANRQHVVVSAIRNQGLNTTEVSALCKRLRVEQENESLFDVETFALQVQEMASEAKVRKPGKQTILGALERLVGVIDDALPSDARTPEEQVAVLEARRILEACGG